MAHSPSTAVTAAANKALSPNGLIRSFTVYLLLRAHCVPGSFPDSRAKAARGKPSLCEFTLPLNEGNERQYRGPSFGADSVVANPPMRGNVSVALKSVPPARSWSRMAAGRGAENWSSQLRSKQGDAVPSGFSCPAYTGSLSVVCFGPCFLHFCAFSVSDFSV